MKSIRKNDVRKGKAVMFALLVTLLSPMGVLAEGDGWEESTIHRGKIQVRYRISQRINQAGEEVPLIEFSASTVETLNYQDCLSLMMDIDRHSEILDAQRSELISTLSDHEWITYYVYPQAGPIPPSDAVMYFRYSQSDQGNTTTFTLDAAPEEFPYCGMERVRFDHETYRFRNLGNGEVEISVEIQVTPAMDVPQWMLNLAFPGAAGDVIKNMVNLLK